MVLVMPLRRKLRPGPPAVATSSSVARSSIECLHEVQFNSLCVSCGAHITKSKTEDTPAIKELTMTGGAQLVLSEGEALKQQELKVSNLRSSRKLAVVLDLDHTLIHTTGIDSPPQNTEDLEKHVVHYVTIDERVKIQDKQVFVKKHFLVKKRPFLDQFLNDNAELFQFSIYTAGTRLYAEAIAKLIDPTGKLFGGRIVSRSDVANDTKMGLEKSLHRIFLGDASMALIVDDREDVWQGEQGEQLILVRPFSHFKGAVEVNNAAGPGVEMSGGGERLIALVEEQLQQGAITDMDDQLLRVAQVLRDLHGSFYADTSTSPLAGPRHTASLLKGRKDAILRGCVVTFSGLIPVNEPDPAEKCLLWRLALSLGAQVSYELSDRTTHLVTSQSTTRKVEGCHSNMPNTWIVHPDWLMYCRWALTKAPEKTFMMFPGQEGEPLPEPTLDTSPLEPKLLEIPAAVQRANEQALRDAYEANGGADLDDDLRPLAKRPRVGPQTTGDDSGGGSDKSDDEDVYGDFDI